MSSQNLGMFGFGALGQHAIGEADYIGGGDNPPTRLGGPIALIALIAAIAQPDPWTYNFCGGGQPYAPRRLPVAITAVATDQPPITKGGPVVIPASIVALHQPDPWVYRLPGAHEGEQPYGARKLNPSITAVPVNDPPFSHPGRFPIDLVVQFSQPDRQRDPWIYTYLGGRQPYDPARIPAAALGVAADNPPFDRRNAATGAELVALNQADPKFDPWPYTFAGGAQPYAAQKRLAGVPGFSVDRPPFSQRRAATGAELVTLNQPAVWTYTFEGGKQPYAPTPLSPVISDVPVSLPGSGSRRLGQISGFEETKPKPVRPIWDRARAKEQAPAPPAVPAKPSGPPAPPPMSLFDRSASDKSTLDTAALPSFDHLVPGDPMGLARRLHEAQDLSDAQAVLRALGLIP